ncbi:MAG TPA: hypothetical protein VGW38_27855 [Chloroflexota bacterium]|nr:hypothetical protein [Chloroflexota bacterium]
MSVEECALLLNQVGTDWHFHDQRQTNPLFPEGDTDGLVDGVPTTVSYQTVPWITEILDQVLHQGAITTTRVPFRPYTLPALLQRSLLLIADKEGIVARWRQEVTMAVRDASSDHPGVMNSLMAYHAPCAVASTRHTVDDEDAELAATGHHGAGGVGLVHDPFWESFVGGALREWLLLRRLRRGAG